MWIEWFDLEMKRDHSVVFEIAPKYCIQDSFVDYEIAGLKLNIYKTKIMASSLTTWSQIGEKWNQVYVPTTDAKEAEVDWFYEDVLQN